MEVVMCPSCFELYIKKRLTPKNDKFICPKPRCNSNVVDIDEQIAVVIQSLNTKGYETLYCCGGHPYLEPLTQPYITFKVWCVPTTCPTGWSYDGEGKQCTITFEPGKEIDYWQGMKNLHEWVASLQHAPERVIN